MKEILKKLFNKYDIKYNENILNKFQTYYEYTIKINQLFNLTAITDKYEFATKHFLDCVICEKYLPANSTIVDIGPGAGFPSIPLKIIRDDLNIVMVDSLNKRVNFLNDVIKLLDLKNITAVHSRAEDFANLNREKFDVAIARAVANMSTLSEYCLPLVKVGGNFISLKGTNVNEELDESRNAIKILGGELDFVDNIKIDEIEGERNIVIVKKIQNTDKKYPRSKNQPRQNPLK